MVDVMLVLLIIFMVTAPLMLAALSSRQSTWARNTSLATTRPVWSFISLAKISICAFLVVASYSKERMSVTTKAPKIMILLGIKEK
eukprot:gene15292-20255_t